jgi:hypothetical protein
MRKLIIRGELREGFEMQKAHQERRRVVEALLVEGFIGLGLELQQVLLAVAGGLPVPEQAAGGGEALLELPVADCEALRTCVLEQH